MTKKKGIRKVNEKVKPEKEFLIRFTAKKRDNYKIGSYFRTLVRPENLHIYVGEDNAKKAIIKALQCEFDKYTHKVYNNGKIEFWVI